MSWPNADVMFKAQIIKKRRDIKVNVSLELEKGSSLGLFGASGMGKSTILACIAGIEEPDDGYVEVNGLKFFPPSLALYKRPIGYLTQEPSLFPHLSVSENITFGIPKSRSSGKEQIDWIKTLRDRLQLTELWNVPASLISGGQA